jgi:hypothetical protein
LGRKIGVPQLELGNEGIELKPGERVIYVPKEEAKS